MPSVYGHRHHLSMLTLISYGLHIQSKGKRASYSQQNLLGQFPFFQKLVGEIAWLAAQLKRTFDSSKKMVRTSQDSMAEEKIDLWEEAKQKEVPYMRLVMTQFLKQEDPLTRRNRL